MKRIAGLLSVFFTISSLLLNISSYGQLNGVNSINPTGTNFTGNPGGVAGKNYTSFNNAVNALKSYGVNSAVIFNVSAGTFTEQVNIHAITGVSATNNVTFQSQNLDSTSVVLSYAARAIDTNYVVCLNGANYFTFKKMTIRATGTTYAYAVQLSNNASHNTFTDNIIQTSIGSLTNTAGIFSTNTSLEQYNLIKDNYISGGYYGIYFYGSSATSEEAGNVIQGNIIKDFYEYGIYAYYEDAIIINKNTLINSTQSTVVYGIYTYYCNDAIQITANKIQINSNSLMYGIYLYNPLGSTTAHGKIANNFISIGGTSSSNIYGIYYSSLNPIYQDISYNSVNIYATASTSYDIYLYTTSTTSTYVNLTDNIFANFGGGYTIYVYSNAMSLTSSNYNDLYSTGSNLANWVSTQCTNLSSWKTVSGKDANSVSINPGFYSNTDLHVNTSGINNKGIPVTGITTDIDGDSRSVTTPDIGADEFNVNVNDAGISGMTAPIPPGPGSNPIYVKVKNYGTATLTSVIVNWQVNGVLQTPASFSSLILSQYQESVVNIGSFSFNTGVIYNLKFWTTLPNGSGDGNPENDTFNYNNLQTGISGTFTIGGTTGYYPSFNAALNDLTTKGLVGAVTYMVNPGTYNENVSIPPISGNSAINTITFQSVNHDSTSVDLYYSSTGTTDNYVFQINGASYVTVRQIRIRANGTNYGKTVVLTGNSNYNTFTNNIIISQTGATSNNIAGIYDDGITNDNYNTFSNNFIQGGYYGVYLSGVNTTIRENINKIQNNIIKDYGYYGIYASYQNSVVITGNVIQNSSLSANSYGIYGNYCYDSIKILKNKILVTTTGTNNGLYLNYIISTATTAALVANNFIAQTGTSTGTNIGMNVNYCNYVNIYFNNLSITANSPTNGKAFSLSNGSTINLANNIFANFGGGYSIYITTSSALASSNYNDLYTTGTALGYWNSTSASNLSGWKTTSSMDANSLSIDPMYYSPSDLHISAIGLNGAGKSISYIKDDVDGDLRNITNPCMGADEFQIIHRDASIISLISPINPCPGVLSNVIVKLRNLGLDPIKSTKIKWSINGVMQTPVILSCNLYSSKDTNIFMGTYTFNNTTFYNIKFWADSINMLPDQNHKNDTLICKGIKTTLSGTYTIGVGKDYSSFTEALNDLKSIGICSVTTFVVDSGLYNEQISIPGIAGTSASNTITFKSAGKDSTYVVLNYSALSTTDNYVIQLNGTNYIRFEKITIKASPTGNYAYCVYIMNGASYNMIKNCVLLSSSASSTNAIPLYNPGNSVESYNIIQNNHIVNGYYGIYWYGGSTTSLETGNVIQGNFVEGFCNYGIMTYYQDSIMLNGNTITSNRGYYGIMSYYNYNNTKFINNKISIAGNSTLMGIYLYYCTGTKTKTPLIANNFIALSGTDTKNNAYGIYSNNDNFTKIFYNTISVTCPSTANGRCIYLSSTSTSFSNINIQNNILVNTGGGYTLYFDPMAVTYSYVTICDYNDLYSSGTNLAYYGTKNATNLTSWMTTSSKDAHSISVLPTFVSTTDLHLTNYSPFGVYNVLPEVPTDIDGQTRSPIRPTIGADDKPTYPNDAGVSQIISPNTSDCEGPYTVIATINNYGTVPLTKVDILWSDNGIAKPTIHFTKTIGFLQDTTITLGIDTFYPGLNNKIVVRTNLPNGVADQEPDNDADSLYPIKIFPIPVIDTLINDTVCYNSTATLQAISNNTKIFNWWDQSTGGNEIAQDTLLIIPNLTTSKTYYVEAATPGFPDSLATGNSTTQSEMGNMFVIKAINGNVHIDSFAIQPTVAPGTVMIMVVYYRHGSYKGYENVPAQWTFLGSDTLICKGMDKFNSINVGNILIPANDSFAFYISSADPYTLLNYTNGSKAFSDKNIMVTTGVSIYFPFDNAYVLNRSWNGMVYYSTGSMCTSPRKPVYAVVNKIPGTNHIIDTAFCKGGNLVLNPDAGKGSSYIWKYNNLPGIYSTNSSITIDSTGLYTVSISDTCGYSGRDTYNLIVYNPAVVNFSVKDSIECLTGNKFTFTNKTTADTGLTPTYQWIFEDGKTSVAKSPTHSYSVADTYSVRLIVSLNKGCIDSSETKALYVLAPTHASFNINDSAQCLKENYFRFMDNSGIQNGMSYTKKWFLGNGTTKNDTNTGYKYKTDNIYNIKLVITSKIPGCSDSITKLVEVFPDPVVNLGNDTIVRDNTKLLLDAGQGYDSYSWSTGADSQRITVDSNGVGDGFKEIWVRITKNGCPASDTIKITFSSTISVKDDKWNSNISIYPNPSHGYILVNLNFTEATQVNITVFNIYGETITQFATDNITQKTYPLDLTSSPTGIYFIRMESPKEIRIFKVNVVK